MSKGNCVTALPLPVRAPVLFILAQPTYFSAKVRYVGSSFRQLGRLLQDNCPLAPPSDSTGRRQRRSTLLCNGEDRPSSNQGMIGAQKGGGGARRMGRGGAQLARPVPPSVRHVKDGASFVPRRRKRSRISSVEWGAGREGTMRLGAAFSTSHHSGYFLSS